MDKVNKDGIMAIDISTIPEGVNILDVLRVYEQTGELGYYKDGVYFSLPYSLIPVIHEEDKTDNYIKGVDPIDTN